MDPELAGKVVVITGAARGMGQSYVKAFLEDGCKVVAGDVSWISSLRSYDNAAEFHEELRNNPDVLLVDMDVTDVDAIRAARETTMARFGKVDVLINNAAMRMNNIDPSGSVRGLELAIDKWERMFDVNTLGIVRTIQEFSKTMIEQKRGSIINVGGGTGLGGRHADGTPRVGGTKRPTTDAPYAASKAAMLDLTISLAADLRPYNVAINVMIPGAPRTTGYEEQLTAREEQGARALPALKLGAMLPLVRLMAKQDASSGFTGRVLMAAIWNMEHGLGDYYHWISKSPGDR